MILEHIDILNFKNIADADLNFCPGINCLLGKNGMGKSNLLEAIHFLSFARPISSMPETALMRHGQEMMLVKGDYIMDRGSMEKISCGLTSGKGKTLKLNGKEYQRISEHIGKFPIVSVSPQDSILISGSASERRKTSDMVISQANKNYLISLIQYNRALEARNKMLRAGIRDRILYESIENSMEEYSDVIYQARAQWVDEISPTFEHYYREISGGVEKASIKYRSVLHQDLKLRDLLRQREARDIALGFTSQGVHRDDIEMLLDGYSARRLGSQGQIKTFTIAFRLAIFNYLKTRGGETPLLLLDDIFDKLDALRVGNIMELVSSDSNFRQIFITDTNRKHLDEIIQHIKGDNKLVEVEEGKFKPLIER